jgi:hypothetical protein
MRRFIGGREALRKLGFRAEDLFLEVAPSAVLGTLGAFVTLRTQGKTFRIECGPVDDPSALGAEYERVSAAVNEGAVSQGDLDRMWQESEEHRRPREFVEAVMRKGLTLPMLRS